MNSQAHFAHVADSGARCFWSHTRSPEFSGHHGVGLVLSSASPFGEATDSTAGVYRNPLKNRYLLLKTTLGDRRVYVHVVYAPQKDTHRGEFFRALPTCFNEGDEDEEEDCASHIVLGDFNVTMDDMLDQLSPDHKAGRGCDELTDWLDALGLVDAWRFINPDERDFTSPTRKNRIDYCFLTADLLQYNLDSVTHIKNRTWLREDHVPVEFCLQANFLPRLSKPQWRCPPWLLQDKEVQTYLSESLDSLADRIKIFPGANPGC
ncbi:hypothetical protein P3T76_001780 [Phytophthora citrophthora]|uniref:Endonuclease/exonuclease/phosphatase domain-containing protein n=1 Tax=Phytophthora citrophthora TaxID=4793 RepID=A0AAD9GWY3_9STRA|nr:hypothetical protein P3T76_001780 [Phytophthora citrophthora]